VLDWLIDWLSLAARLYTGLIVLRAEVGRAQPPLVCHLLFAREKKSGAESGRVEDLAGGAQGSEIT
jgi:hypothetical protein